MQETAGQKREPLRPILGAATCVLLYWIGLNLLVPAGRFVAGEIVATTVPPLLAAAIAGSLSMAIFESGTLADLGLDWMPGSGRNLLKGIGLGSAAALLVILPALPLGLAHYEAIPRADVSLRGALFLPILLFCGAMGEEVAFHGFPLQFLMNGYGNWAGILTLGTLFGLAHGINPGATTFGLINTGLFGVLFGAAILRSRDLWLPIGMHFGWNLVFPFLGVQLSGLTIGVTGYKLVWTAGNLWSGGDYGPEASVLTSVVLVLLSLAVWKMPFARGRTSLLDAAGLLDAPVPGDASASS
jgi:membrane protease YdiL (CAAX protease family)